MTILQTGIELDKSWYFSVEHVILYSYFMPVCSIDKTVTPRCRGLPDALLHEAEGQVQ